MSFYRNIRKRMSLFIAGINPAQCGYLADSARIDHTAKVYAPSNLYMYEDTNIDGDAVIMNTRAKFIMKKWSGAAFGLKVITGSHLSIPGMHFKQVTDEVKDKYDVNHEMDQDVTVEEDVWLASNVTLLKGVKIGRGGVIGSGAVVRNSTPPYAIVMGNPAKIVGFRFTPEETVKHEKALYPEEERIPVETLEKNYNKYFLKRTREIMQFMRM